ncbi:MAG: DUF4338 domain-containing protein [Rhodobacteraceae bacterium]|nr:DUF4338 domain-containing protein [Paracoccaceae bacterium]
MNNRPRRLDADISESAWVPSYLAVIGDLNVQVVNTIPDHALWNTLIVREHPHGMTNFPGCQLRYLVGSSHGWQGAAEFSAAALRVSAWG